MRRLIAITALGLSASLPAAERSYDLKLTLLDRDRYLGQETVTFDAERDAPGVIRLKFIGGTITAARINSVSAKVNAIADGVELSGPALKAGANAVDVVFAHSYVKEGSGLHAWTDPKDGTTYVYSQPGRDHPESVFPVLEDSNDAALQLAVVAPGNWAVSSEGANPAALSLYAGPFKVSEFKSAAGIPVRLLVPQSMSGSVSAEEWFATAQLALAYYPWYLRTPYPFRKYDQVILASPAGTREDRVRAVFSAVASQWFGRSVAIDDAALLTLMAYQGVHDAANLVDAWEQFLLNEKQGAYSRAAALREIFFTLGPQTVQEGLADFLRDFANRSATIDDVMTSLEKASHERLQNLEKEWLSTSGVNTVTPRYACEHGRIRSFSVTQSEPRRSHVSEVALYKNYKLIQTTRISFSRPRTALKQLGRQPCPDAVYLNVEDFDYVNEVFEPHTLTALRNGIENFADPLFRLKGWMALWKEVQTQTLPKKSYVDMALRGLAQEHDPVVAQYVLATLCRKGDEESCLRAKQALPPPPPSHAH